MFLTFSPTPTGNNARLWATGRSEGVGRLAHQFRTILQCGCSLSMLRMLPVPALNCTSPWHTTTNINPGQSKLNYLQMKRHIPERAARYKSFAVAEPTNCPSLQAADLITGWYAKGWTAARAHVRQLPEDIRTIKRLGRRRLALPYCSANEMEQLLDDMEVELGQGVREWLLQLDPQKAGPQQSVIVRSSLSFANHPSTCGVQTNLRPAHPTLPLRSG